MRAAEISAAFFVELCAYFVMFLNCLLGNTLSNHFILTYNYVSFNQNLCSWYRYAGCSFQRGLRSGGAQTR